MKRLICFFLIISQPVFADNVIHLNKTDPAPYAGYLFTPDMEKKLRQTDLDATFYKSQNIQLNAVITTQNDEISKLGQQITLRNNELDSMEKRISSSEGFFTKAAWFISGALITGLLAQGIYRTK